MAQLLNLKPPPP